MSFNLKISILIILFASLTAFEIKQEVRLEPHSPTIRDPLKQEVFNILDTKCNVCHRKRMPFMVFSEKNMTKRASRIYRMVFVEKRMPKGNEIRLSTDESTKLKQWLHAQNISNNGNIN